MPIQTETIAARDENPFRSAHFLLLHYLHCTISITEFNANYKCLPQFRQTKKIRPQSFCDRISILCVFAAAILILFAAAAGAGIVAADFLGRLGYGFRRAFRRTVGDEFRVVRKVFGRFHGPHRGTVDLDTHFQEHGDGARLDALDHLVEHFETFLFVGDDGIHVAVCAQAYALSELIHRVDLIDPVAVHVHQEETALHVRVIDAELLAHFRDLFVVRLFRLFDDLFKGVIVIPFIQFILRDEPAPLGKEALFERAVERFRIPFFGHLVHVDGAL